MKKIIFTIIAIFDIAFILTCTKMDISPVTKITTVSATATTTTISASGTIVDLSKSSHSEHGFCYGTTANPTITTGKVSLGTAKIGAFNGVIEGLAMGQQYYIRAYCKEGGSFVYGESKTVTTTTGYIPSITTTAATSITNTTVTTGGNVTSDGNATITERGVCYSTSANPTTTSSKVIVTGTTGAFTCNLIGLVSNTTYYVKAYATNSVGTSYGAQVSFTTKNALGTLIEDFSSLVTYVNPSNLPGWSVYKEIGSLEWARKYYLTEIYVGMHNFNTGLSEVKTWLITPLLDFSSSNRGLTFKTKGAFWTHTINKPLTVMISTDYNGSNMLQSNWYLLSSARIATEGDGLYNWVGSGKIDLSGYSGVGYLAFIYYGNTTETTSIAIDDVCFGQLSSIVSLPYLKTNTITSITTNSMVASGTITDDGGGTITAHGFCWATVIEPTLLNSFIQVGSGTGTFTSNITGLAANTTYHLRPYATNSMGTAYGNEITITTYKTDAIKDADNNYYNIVTIGTQVWMQENLKTTKYRDGSSIPNITDNTTWTNQTTGAYCWYNNDAETYKTTYGALYNWYTIVDSRNLCPVGWHIPTYDEWATLVTFLGGYTVAGGKLKATMLWNSPNTGATNESGFAGLPGSYRSGNGSFYVLGYYGYWWGSDVTDFSYGLSYDHPFTMLSYSEKNYGYSVRCVRD